MELDQQLIKRLRDLADHGATIRAMVDEIRNRVRTEDGLALAVDAYFWKAFLLPLGQVRDVEGSSCLGGKVYTDEQIDQLMLPRIEGTRHRWQRE